MRGEVAASLRAAGEGRYLRGSQASLATQHLTRARAIAGRPHRDRASDQRHFPFFSILAHVSRSVTARLNTSFPGAESLSTQKYPRRSNWNVLPTGEPATDGSNLHAASVSSERGFKFARNV